MTITLDLKPAAETMENLLAGITAGHLSAPTPCEDYSLATLLDHVGGLSQAFAAAARKDLGPTSYAPSPDGTRLDDDWPPGSPSNCTPSPTRGRTPAPGKE